MRSPSTGRLLEEVAYCMRKPCKATNIINEKIEVRDTFPYNPDSKTAPVTAERWADQTPWSAEKTYTPEVIVRDNEPFSLTITDLDVRSEGGRAYKVIDADNRRFDLREDQVLEVMKRVGIQPRGVVPGEFVWGIVGSQVRLVLVGGDLHTSMVMQLNDKKSFELAQAAGLTPTEGTLQPGHVYRKKDKSLHVFLGRVKCPGDNKAKFAFVEMPTREEDDENEASEAELRAGMMNNDKWIDAHLKERAVMKGWDSMTWRERCEFDWVGRWRLYDYTGNGLSENYCDIKLMSSPKFEADVGDVGPEFLVELKDNVDAKHAYVAASATWKNDLSETWKLGANYDRHYHNPNTDHRLPYEERQRQQREHERLVQLDVIQTRKEFRDALVWS